MSVFHNFEASLIFKIIGSKFLEQFKQTDTVIGVEVAATESDLSEKSPEADRQLTELEVGVIELFVSIVRLLGIPKSVAEIYGLLFISAEPLALDAVVSRLRISKGSASQGLKLLRNLGAIKPVYVAGDRRDHYSAETELKKLVGGFIREELQPKLESGEQRLQRLSRTAAESGSDPEKAAFYRGRIGKLAQWHARSRSLMPLLTGMLE